MKLILLLILLTPLFLFAQNYVTITEGSEAEICGKTVVVDGIWIDNYEIKADISVLVQKNSKPITGAYKMYDSISIASGCIYKVSTITKFGLNTDKGTITLTKSDAIHDFLTAILPNLKLNDKFNIGYNEWTVKLISKDKAEFEIISGVVSDRQTLKKNDIIWKGFEAYYISDFLANASDKLNEQWSIELKQVKDYTYLNPNAPCIDGELINAPPK